MNFFLATAGLLMGFVTIACDRGHENLPGQSRSREESPTRLSRIPQQTIIPRTRRSDDLPSLNPPSNSPTASPPTHQRKTSDEVIIIPPTHWTRSPGIQKR